MGQAGALLAVCTLIATVICTWIWHPLYTTTDEMFERIKSIMQRMRQDFFDPALKMLKKLVSRKDADDAEAFTRRGSRNLDYL